MSEAVAESEDAAKKPPWNFVFFFFRFLEAWVCFFFLFCHLFGKSSGFLLCLQSIVFFSISRHSFIHALLHFFLYFGKWVAWLELKHFLISC